MEIVTEKVVNGLVLNTLLDFNLVTKTKLLLVDLSNVTDSTITV